MPYGPFAVALKQEPACLQVPCMSSARLDVVPPPGVGEGKHLCHWIEAHSEGAGLCWLVDNVAKSMFNNACGGARGAMSGVLREGK